MLPSLAEAKHGNEEPGIHAQLATANAAITRHKNTIASLVVSLAKQQAELVALRKALEICEQDRDAYKFCYEFIGGK